MLCIIAQLQIFCNCKTLQDWVMGGFGALILNMLGCVPLNPIVWCYVWYYVWLNVMINKVVLLLSKIMVTWIFGYYHIIHEIHSMWFMWKVTEDINHKFFVNLEL